MRKILQLHFSRVFADYSAYYQLKLVNHDILPLGINLDIFWERCQIIIFAKNLLTSHKV